MYSNRGTLAKIAAVVLVIGGFTVIQSNTEPAQADGATVQRHWTYTHANPAGSTPIPKSATLTYSPSDSPYDAIKRECARQGALVPHPGSDLEKIVASKPDFYLPQAEGGYAARAYMLLADDELFSNSACANSPIQWS